MKGREDPEEKKEVNDKRIERAIEVLGVGSQRLPLEEANQSLGGTSSPGHDVIKPESIDQHSAVQSLEATVHSRASVWF